MYVAQNGEAVTLGKDAAPPTEPWADHNVRFTVRRAPSAAVVSAHGELDASNAGRLADYAQSCAVHSTRLILDLTGLEFFGTAGFSTLHMINVRFVGAGVRWAVVPSRAVWRLLRICDPDRALPTSQSVSAALDDGDDPRGLFELVPQSRQRFGE
jgi:anti-anti-sigma factor